MWSEQTGRRDVGSRRASPTSAGTETVRPSSPRIASPGRPGRIRVRRRKLAHAAGTASRTGCTSTATSTTILGGGVRRSLARRLGLDDDWRQGLADPCATTRCSRGLLNDWIVRWTCGTSSSPSVEKIDRGSATIETALPRCGRPGGTRSKRTRRSREVGRSTPRRTPGQSRSSSATRRTANSTSARRTSARTSGPRRPPSMLIESILRGIPLPSIIILEQVDADRVTSYEVVDGKQRLTSILRFIGCHPRRRGDRRGQGEEWGEPDLLTTFQKDYPQFKSSGRRTSLDAPHGAGRASSLLPVPAPVR